MSVFLLRLEKPTIFYKICIFPTLNDDITANCPALKKPFSSFFFFFFFSLASVLSGVASAIPPRDVWLTENKLLLYTFLESHVFCEYMKIKNVFFFQAGQIEKQVDRQA